MPELSNDLKAEIAEIQALWYAWGWEDSGAIPCKVCNFTRPAHEGELSRGHRYTMPQIEVWEFAGRVKANHVAYISGETHYLESIQGQWQTFLAEKSGE